MKKYAISLILSCCLIGCSDDPKPAVPPPGAPGALPNPIPPAPPPPKIVKISPETAYLRSLGSKANTWNLSEIASFAFIAKKQIYTARTLQNEDIFKSPLHRNKFLAQIYGLSTLLTYMRIPLSKVNQGDIAPIRFAALDTVKMSNFARKTKHAGEAMIFCERTKEDYLKVNELANRELLKPKVTAPYITEELRINIFQSLENVRKLLESFEIADITDQKQGLLDIKSAMDDTFNAVTAVEEQTEGLGYKLDDDKPVATVQSNMMTPSGFASLTPTENAPTVAQSYGFPSAQSLIQSGNTSKPITPGSPLPNMPGFTNPGQPPASSPTGTPSPWVSMQPPTPASRIGSTVSAEAATGPYGYTPPTAPSLIPGMPPGAGGGILPSLSSLGSGNYSGAPQAQPMMPTIPSAPPPPPPPPPPTGAPPTQ